MPFVDNLVHWLGREPKVQEADRLPYRQGLGNLYGVTWDEDRQLYVHASGASYPETVIEGWLHQEAEQGLVHPR